MKYCSLSLDQENKAEKEYFWLDEMVIDRTKFDSLRFDNGNISGESPRFISGPKGRTIRKVMGGGEF